MFQPLARELADLHTIVLPDVRGYLDELAPIIGTLVRDAIPRSDPMSIAAAAAIGRDRSFRSVAEVAVIAAPTLIIPGMDEGRSRKTESLAAGHRSRGERVWPRRALNVRA